MTACRQSKTMKMDNYDVGRLYQPPRGNHAAEWRFTKTPYSSDFLERSGP